MIAESRSRFAPLNLVLKSVLFLALCVDHSLQIGTTCPVSLFGTTPFLEDIFIGRCAYFLNRLHATDCDIKSQNISCPALYEAFAEAVYQKDPCDVKIEDYNKFLKLADHPIPENKTMFWSGTYTPAHELSKSRKYWSLEDTLSGYLLNDLIFCSTKGNSSYARVCPRTCVETNNPFWNAASRDFAAATRGTAVIVLNGTRTIGAVYNQSTFFLQELPQLNAAYVTRLDVLLVHTPGLPKYETCSDPVTLTYLRARLAEKGIGYSCQDNPDFIKLFLCFQDPSSRECQALYYLTQRSSSLRTSSLIVVLCQLVFSLLVSRTS